MVEKIFCTLIIKFLKKGGKEMMAMFFAQRIILDKNKFKDVPNTLKTAVAEILIDSGVQHLVPVDYGGTMQ